jgi:uncharacterized membrane protein
MKGLPEFIKTTVVGGVLYLVPIIALLAVVGKAHEMTSKLVVPLASRIPFESPFGLEKPKLLAILVLVFFCFLAGLFAKTDRAKKIVDWVEDTILGNLPGYGFMKSLGESMVGIEKEGAHEVVLARIEDAWQIAFLVERIEGGHVAVFVPGAPSPWSGSVYFMTDDRIKSLDVPLKSALNCVKRLGLGSKAMMQGRL